MDSLKSMINKQRPIEPPQVAALKKYAFDVYEVEIEVKVSANHYLIRVPGASLAQKFRFETAKIIAECNLDKKLVIHIGY